MPTHPRIKAGIIGFGRMGEMYLKQMLKSSQWEICAICDIDPNAWPLPAEPCSPDTILTTDEQVLLIIRKSVFWFYPPADSRKRHLFKAVEHHKHVITEKPVGSTIEEEYDVLEKILESDIMVTVDLPLRECMVSQDHQKFHRNRRDR